MRRRNKRGWRGKRRGKGRTREGGKEGCEGAQDGEGDTEVELPMALNQLAPVPGSLSGVREALREAGRQNTGSGGSEFQRVTHTHRQDRQDTGNCGGGKGQWEPLSHVVQQVTPPNPSISQTTEFSSGGWEKRGSHYPRSYGPALGVMSTMPMEWGGGDSETWNRMRP